MEKMSILVSEEKEDGFCGLALHLKAIACAFTQFVLTVITSICLYEFLDIRSVLVDILIALNIFCAVSALVFIALCVSGRKFGSAYDLILHAYLLSMLLTALTSLFEIMYFPLSFLQTIHDWSPSTIFHATFLTLLSVTTLIFQLLQRSTIEGMLSYMQYSFK
ncbi:hypothetical protein AB6A40_005265 [Gnathostoma spinigerum]|uniref:MARVEL domain-containing protein n=1 Tax=Gnathostoma spinigerum TaxID=75299 RepID=A0ABD6EH66_9BILA